MSDAKLSQLWAEAKELCDDFDHDVIGLSEFQSGMVRLVGPLLGLAKYQQAEIADLKDKLVRMAMPTP